MGEALAANNLAEVFSLQGRYDEADDLFEFAKRTWEDAGSPFGVAFVTANLALVQARSGQSRMGLAMLGSARFLSQELGASALALEMDVRRIECLILDGQVDLALAEATPLHDRLVGEHEGDDELTTQLLPLLALAQWATGDHDAAEQTLVRTIERAEAESNHYITALGSVVEAELVSARGDDPAPVRERATILLERLGVVELPAVLSRVLPRLALPSRSGGSAGR